jgi:hypothetical protein
VGCDWFGCNRESGNALRGLRSERDDVRASNGCRCIMDNTEAGARAHSRHCRPAWVIKWARANRATCENGAKKPHGASEVQPADLVDVTRHLATVFPTTATAHPSVSQPRKIPAGEKKVRQVHIKVCEVCAREIVEEFERDAVPVDEGGTESTGDAVE